MKRALLLALGALMAAVAWADPPPVVGRVAWLAGPVSLQQADGGTMPAQINWPITAGVALASGSSGRAEVWIGSTAVRLDVNSRVVFDRVDEHTLALHLERGTLALRVATAEAAKGASVETPLGRFQPQAPGAFRIDLQGAAVAASAAQGDLSWQPGGTTTTLRAGQRVVARPHAGSGFDVETVALQDDDFAHFVQSRDAAYEGRGAARYVSPEMTGVESLDAYGHWSQVAEYGAVWWPDVAPGWVPYRSGRWVSIEPWGWTWIAAEPWGFAPFHYGRWVLWQGRWGWVPGSYVARPVYAPALVGWLGAPGPSAGWFPLGPREAYVPGFSASVSYVRRVNVGHAAPPALPPPGVAPPSASSYRYGREALAVTRAPVEAWPREREFEREPAFERRGWRERR